MAKDCIIKACVLERKNECIWVDLDNLRGTYETGCGVESWTSPAGFVYCPYCGGEIE